MKNFAPAALGAVAILAAFALPAQANSGVASFYGPGFAGKKTANGERFNPGALTAAHRSLPFGTRLKLTNTANGRSVVVRINDRGPFVGGRVLDVSQGAASALGFVSAGTARLKIETLSGRQVAANDPAPAPRATQQSSAPSAQDEADLAAQRLEEQRSKV